MGPRNRAATGQVARLWLERTTKDSSKPSFEGYKPDKHQVIAGVRPWSTPGEGAGGDLNTGSAYHKARHFTCGQCAARFLRQPGQSIKICSNCAIKP